MKRKKAHVDKRDDVDSLKVRREEKRREEVWIINFIHCKLPLSMMKNMHVLKIDDP